MPIANAGYVFGKYIDHLKNDIHTNASTGFFKGLAPVKKLRSYYVIGDTAGKTECFVDTHGEIFRPTTFWTTRNSRSRPV
jgi:hypothetical protein